VADTAGYDDRHVGLNRRDLAVDDHFALSLFDTEELVPVGVDFLADLVAGLQHHQHELQLLAGVENAAEVGVILGQIFNIVDKAIHGSFSFMAGEFARAQASDTRSTAPCSLGRL
jgi:hypothetical protein